MTEELLEYSKPLPPRLDPEVQSILAECLKSTKFLARHLFPGRFSAEFDPPHDEIFRRVDYPKGRKVGIAAPRGIGKTSIVGLALAAKAILFRECHYIVYVSNSLTVALEQTENLKRELCTNRLVKQLFGDIRTNAVEEDDGIDESFSKHAWVANDCIVVPRGSNQQVRGHLYRNYRPDLIIVDDLEDTETIGNEEIRARRRKWFMDDLLKSVSHTDKNWRVLYIDTIKHQASLLSEILVWTDWDTVRLEMCGDDLKSNFPHFMNDEEVKQTFNEHVEKGMVDSFFQEYRNLIIAPGDACYKLEYFKYYEEEVEKLNEKRAVVSVVLVDPAKTVKTHSAETGIVGWGVDTRANRLYLRDAIGAKLHPDQIYDATFNMALKLQAKVIGVEVNSLEDFFMQPFINEMHRRGLHFTVIPLPARGKKEKRDEALISYYRKGLVYHNKAISGPLEAQMLSFPANARWDLLDAANYLIPLLEEGEVYFEPVEDLNDPESEYKDLVDEDEDPVEGWMLV